MTGNLPRRRLSKRTVTARLLGLAVAIVGLASLTH